MPSSRASPASTGKTRFRHYVNIDRMEGRLKSLLADFRWGRMDHIFLPEPAAAEVASAGRSSACLPSRRREPAARWDAFVFACPQATFFHRAAWQAVLGAAFRHDTYFLYAERGGQIDGVLPLAHVKSLLFGNALVSLPFAVYGGVAASDDAAADALEHEAQRIAQKLGVDHLELRQVERRHADWPRQDLYVTFRKAILADEEANMLAIPRKQRAMVRKGIKNGLTSTHRRRRRPLLRPLRRQRASPRHAGLAEAILPDPARSLRRRLRAC